MFRAALPFRKYVVAAAALLCCGRLLCAQGIAIRTDQLPWAIKGEPYTAEVVTRVSGRCPISDVRLSVIAGELPKGLDLFTYGLEGTPLQMGTYHFTLEAANSCGTAIHQMRLLVTGRPILLVSPAHVVLDQTVGVENGPEDIVKVEASWPELAYSVMILNAAPWLSVSPAEGKTPGPDSAFTGDRVQLHAKAGNLAPGIYHATLKFYAKSSQNAPTVDVTLQVHKTE
jgi:hypothetical protein